MSLNSSKELEIKYITTIDDFLSHFEDSGSIDIQNGIVLDFDFDLKPNSNKIRPILQLAEPKDAEKISKMFVEVYEGGYPYREVQDPKLIRKMIKDSNFQWILFKLKPNDIVGCVGTHLELKKKKGYLFGFIIRNKYRDQIDVIGTFAGYLRYACARYKNKILVWYSETRTAHNIAQYGQTLCGLIPVAFFPNKDVFVNKVESDFFHISYDKETLKKYRKKNPKIIRQVLNCYLYSNDIYHLGVPIIENPTVNYDSVKINEIEEKIVRRKEIIHDIYDRVKFSVRKSDSFFQFIYNRKNKSIEQTKYYVNSLEELSIFLKELKAFFREMEVRYFECFVSSYEPTHQKIFYEKGFRPRGYVPCWKYNKKQNIFEDCIVFNSFKRDFDRNLALIPQTTKLLQSLGLLKKKIIPDLELGNKLTARFLDDPIEILNYLQIGISIPIFPEFYKYIIHDLIFFKAKSILLLENGNPVGHTLIYNGGGDMLFFGYFSVLTHDENKINLLIETIIKYAKENEFKSIRGPINVPTVIFGWGFMEKGSRGNIYIGKPVNPPIYQELFFKKNFYVQNSQDTWEGPYPRYNPWKIKKYDFSNYEFFVPKNWKELMELKSEFLRLHAKNLPSYSTITPSAGTLFDMYAKFVLEYGDYYMFTFVREKSTKKIVGCGVFFLNPFRKDAKGNYDSIVGYSYAIDEKHRRKGLITLMIGATTLKTWKRKIRYGSGVTSEKNISSIGYAEKIGLFHSRTHLILELKF